MHYEIRLAGIGGQGMGFGGTVYAEAIALGSGYEVSVTQEYDFRARGGESVTDLVVSDSEIYYPAMTKIDFLLAMGGNALTASKKILGPKSVVIINSDHLDPSALQPLSPLVYSFPFTSLARENTGTSITATMIGLAVLTRLSGLSDLTVLKKVVERRSPRKAAESNLKALEVGENMELPHLLEVDKGAEN